MSEFLLRTRTIYFLPMILLGLFGIFLGFLLGLYSIYRREDEIAEIYALLLLRILYNNDLIKFY